MKTFVLLILFWLLCSACNLVQTPAAPPPTVTLSALETYTNSAYGYTIQYPSGLLLESNEDGSYVWVDHQISITISNINPEGMQGDGPVIESAVDTAVGPYRGRRLSGSIGSIGGNTPQNYASVVIPHDGLYFVITVFELKNDAPLDDTHQPAAIPSDALARFEQVLASLHFADEG